MGAMATGMPGEPVGRTVSAIDGRLSHVDAAFCALLQMREGDLIGRDIMDITHVDDRPDNAIDMRRLRDEGRSFEIRKRYVRKDGSAVWTQVRAAVVAPRFGDMCIGGQIYLATPSFETADRRAQRRRIDEALDRLAMISQARLFGH